jgi:hypothetical protein
MSGPKVIDVVPLQQVIDTCRVALAEVDTALADWQRIMDRNMISAPADLAQLKAKRDVLHGMLADGSFVDLQKSAAALRTAIETSVQQHLTTHASETASKHRQKQSLRFSAQAILARAREMPIELPAECVQILSDAAAGRSLSPEVVTRVLSRAAAELYAQDDATISAQQQDLARLLGATGESMSAADAIGTAEEALRDPRVTRIASQIDVLAGFGQVEAAAAFRSRLAVASEPEAVGNNRQTDLLLTSLEVELVPTVARAQKLHALEREIALEISAAKATQDWDACSKELTAAEADLKRGDTDSARLQLERARALRQQRIKHRAAQASRAAILEGLKELGYEVREGMATQWADRSQLVVRHAAKPGVALELAGTLEGGRLQARMVAVQGSARDPHADKQTEEKWCSEFDLLQKYVAGRGGEIRVVKAVAAGATPLKVVADEQQDEERRENKYREKQL